MAQIGLESAIDEHIVEVVIVAAAIVVVQRPHGVIVGNDEILGDFATPSINEHTSTIPAVWWRVRRNRRW